MALYACDEDDLIYAGEAEQGKVYWCLECFQAVKMRRGRNRFAHFYHLKASPSCRLYSKSEDHLCAQLELQKYFPKGSIQLERPFPRISRIADACWEQEKIVFEIQCSLIMPPQVESRIRDYRTLGYEVVWLLDDRIYNKRLLRSSEEFLRMHPCYFFSLKKAPAYYDQFEIFAHQNRVKRGKKRPVDLRQPRDLPRMSFEKLPTQIQLRLGHGSKYFFGDRIDLALKPSWKIAMDNWRILEASLAKKYKKPNRWKIWFKHYLLEPYLRFLDRFND